MLDVPSDLCADLAAVVGAGHCSSDALQRSAYARDLWPRGLLALGAGLPELREEEEGPALVLWPGDAGQVQELVRRCRARRVAVVPFGAGSGVCGGALTRSVLLDLKRLRRFSIDEGRAQVTFEPGILGSHLEERVNRRGYTLGHFPSSIMCSTAGGWLATRGAGQMSTKYGKIEDLVRGLTLVAGTGERLRIGAEEGPDVLQLLVGSEGTLGVITEATCALQRLPAARRMRGWLLPSMEAGAGAMRQLLQAGLRPAVVRLYDELDTLLNQRRRHEAAAPAPEPEDEEVGVDDWLALLRPDAQRASRGLLRMVVGRALSRPGVLNRMVDRFGARLSRGCLLIVGFEGDERLSEVEERAAGELLRQAGGLDQGPGPGEHWLRNRYAVSFKMPKAFAAGAFVDTMEVATTWERLMPLYQAVREAASAHALVMAHCSHAYEGGCSIYFSFAGRRSLSAGMDLAERRRALAEDRRRYDGLWQAGLRAAVRAGGTISHHHGVGLLRGPFMADEHGQGMRLFAALKAALDPEGIMNPGKMGLAAGPAGGQP